ncbi:TonB-dependent receptor [bacterium]|nr:TonB-dependent receptor [bacterium]
MDRSRWLTSLVILVAVSLLVPALVLGQAGKIRGIITDAEGGQLLAGANVMVEGTLLGTATDENGEYLILNVPVGKFNVVATFMGYQKVTVEDVIVTNGLTTYRDVEMPKVVLEGQEVVIVAERPLVDKNATNDIKIIRTENIENLPIRGYANIVAAQAGAVQSGNNIHVRGGREEEVGFYVDGVLMNSPYDNRMTGSVSDNALEEISYQPGGMTSEFGGYNAGVVSTTTRTGGSDLAVSAEVISDQFLGYNEEKFGLGTYSYGYNLYNLSASGPIPFTDSKLRFYGNVEYRFRKDRSPTWAPSVQPSVFNKDLDKLIALSPEPVELPGAKPGNFDIQWNGVGNIYYQLKNFKIKAGGLYYSNVYRNYIHSRAAFNTDYMPKGEETTYTGYLKTTYVISPTAFVELNANLYHTFWEYGDVKIWDDFKNWTNPAVIPNITQWGTTPPSKAQFAQFMTYGTPQTWFWRENNTRMTLKGDGTWQFNKIHELKGGFEAQLYTVRFYDVGSRVANALHQKEVELGRPLNADEIALAYRTGYANNAGYNITGTELENSGESAPRKPKIYSFYVNDKMEFKDMVVNLGLRLDYIDIASKTLKDPENVTITSGLIDPSNYGESATYLEINPRLGFAFPVTDRTVFHLEYGKFTQAANFDNTYITWHRLAADLSQGNYTTSANPNLKPKKTTSYEVGFEQQIGENASLDITAFYKEIRDEVYLKTLTEAQPTAYASYINGDFGNVKGFSFDFQLRRTHRVMANMIYTLQWANGTGSDPDTQYNIAWQNPSERPTYVAPLDYDQRHTATLNVDFRTLPDDGPELLGGHPIGDLGLNIWYTYGSGFAYTPERVLSSIFSTAGSHYPVAAVNSAHWAPSSSFNFKIDKKIDVGPVALTPYVWVINVFNTENVEAIYNSTGLPGDDGYFSIQEGKVWAQANPDAVAWYKARVADPENWGEPRQIRVGLRIDYR